MSDDDNAPTEPLLISDEALRKITHSVLAALTPPEAKALRARFRIEPEGMAPDDDEETLRALARELAVVKWNRKP